MSHKKNDCGYLLRYVGIYRVMADYNQTTNDFIRNENGQIDETFDDYYIKCAKKVKVRYYQDDILYAYIPSVGRANNILKQLYKETFGDDELQKLITGTQCDYNTLEKDLKTKGIIEFVERYDGEIEIYFKADKLDKIIDLLQPVVSSCKRHPLSAKNLPKADYDIPEDDLNEYKQVSQKANLPLQAYGQLFKKFNIKIQELMGKDYDVNAERRKAMLGNKEFIHSIGMWQEYLDFIANFEVQN